jgi:hypothetical protein
VESSSASLSEPENANLIACTEKQHHFGGIYFQINKNVSDGGNEFSMRPIIIASKHLERYFPT